MTSVLTPLFLLRRAIDEPDESTYSDNELNERLANAGEAVNLVARDVWAEKVAASAGFVNVSEGGSSRALSQAHEQAKAMLDYYQGLIDDVLGGTVLRKITRP